MGAEILEFRGLEKAKLLPDGWTEGTSEDGEPWIEVNAVIFYAGTHRGRKFTRASLQAVADAFVEPPEDEDSDIPIQLDHSSSTRDTIGNLRKAWMDGDELKGRLRFEGEEAVRKVRRRKWKRLSAGFYANKGSKGQTLYRFREVSVTPFPQLERASTYSDKDEQENPMPDPIPAPEPTPTVEFNENHPALVQMRQQWEADRKADREQYAKDLADRDKRIAESESILRFQRITSKIETYGRTGKSVPAMDETELALLETFSDEQMELYDKLKTASPAYVDFATVGEQEAPDPGAVTDAAADTDAWKQRAVEYQKKAQGK